MEPFWTFWTFFSLPFPTRPEWFLYAITLWLPGSENENRRKLTFMMVWEKGSERKNEKGEKESERMGEKEEERDRIKDRPLHKHSRFIYICEVFPLLKCWMKVKNRTLQQTSAAENDFLVVNAILQPSRMHHLCDASFPSFLHFFLALFFLSVSELLYNINDSESASEWECCSNKSPFPSLKSTKKLPEISAEIPATEHLRLKIRFLCRYIFEWMNEWM